MQLTQLNDARSIYTVSEVTFDLKKLIEDNFPSLWVSGEVSNLTIAASGHAYFTLKDDESALSCVMFKGNVGNLKFELEDGMEIIVHGRLSVYVPRGSYQILINAAEPQGIGALQLAFEQLKKKLEGEGLFSDERKKPLPFLPFKIGLITSAKGAVIHDMKNVISRRFSTMDIVHFPVKVQGEGAKEEIVAAIEWMNQKTDADVLIIGRGGGSMEDLWAFNEEIVVRAIAASKIPTVSAVGHESDVTLADFAADLRAPTPSAAAELVTPIKDDLVYELEEKSLSLINSIRELISQAEEDVANFRQRLKSPSALLDDVTLRISDLRGRLLRSMDGCFEHRQLTFQNIATRLKTHSPYYPLERGYGFVF